MTDLRYALRQLWKSPGFTAVAVLTLALGIGANALVFGVAKAVLFRPLGFAEADRLLWLQGANTQTGLVDDRLSWREIEDIRESAGSFESVATFGSPGAIWEMGDRAEPVPALKVTPNLADVLRIRPSLGRMLLPSDAAESAEPVALVSHELWKSHFGGSNDVLGRVVRLDGTSHTLVGVLPPGLAFPLERAPSYGNGSSLTPGVRSFWLPMKPPGGLDLTSRNSRMFLPVARLKPGITEAAARAELTALGERLSADHPDSNRHRTFALTNFRDQVLGRTRQAIPILAASVVAVLLIGCVNLANLLLARGMARQRELAVRAALGAGRRRLLGTLLTECLLLALLGGGGGILLAQIALVGIRGMDTSAVPFLAEARIDNATAAFTAGLAVLTAFVFGLLPSLWQSGVHAIDALRGGVRATVGPGMRAWQHRLLTAQVAAVLALLASAGLLLESFRRLIGQDLGYRPRPVMALDLDTWGFDSNTDVCRMYRNLRARLAALPGVEAVGTVSSAPLTGKWIFDEKVQVAGTYVPEADRPVLAATFVAFDYFQAMGIPLLEGRLFREEELKDTGYGQIVVVNEAAAKLLFPGRSALGGRFTVGSNPDRVLEVIGIVKDTRDVRLEAKPQPRFYWQYAFGGAQVVIRTTAPAMVAMKTLRELVQQTDRRILIQGIRPMSDIVAGTVAERRFLMLMLTSYAAVALGIAVVGIFGVVACQVAQRSNEFGIRMALGSTPAGVLRLVLRQSLRVVFTGVLAGVLLALGAGRFLASQVFEISPHDPFLLAGASLLMVAAAAAASLLPARRAAQVDPMVALRSE